MRSYRQEAKRFYDSAKWESVREMVLIRDKYKCRLCGDSGRLEVHHVKHINADNINDASVTLNANNLITLCRDCHFKQHELDRLNGVKSAQDEAGDGLMFDENGYLIERAVPPVRK